MNLILLIAALAGAPDTTAFPPPPQPMADTALLEPTKDSAAARKSLDSAWIDLSAIPNAPKSIDMKEKIAEYFLYWNTVYTLHIANDGVSVIEPPQGFAFEAAIIGNSKLFAVQQTKNRVTLKKLAFDNVNTNLTLVMTAPDGETHSVAIDIRGGNSTTMIARFVIPTNRETNATIEKVKSSYLSQMTLKLQDQEGVLNGSVWKNTMIEQDIFRIPQDLIETEESWKGATFRLDAVANSRDEAFVYMTTDASDAECQVVDLISIESRDGIVKKTAYIVARQRIDRKWTRLVYSTGRMEPGKWNFLVKIWSRAFTIKTELQLTGKGSN